MNLYSKRHELYVLQIQGEYHDKERYIFLSGKTKEDIKESFSILARLIEKEIYVDGFASNNEEFIDMILFRKRVFSVDSISKHNTVVFVGETQCEYAIDNTCVVKLGINPLINQNDVVIYGAGKVGREVCKNLQNKGYKIRAFIDSNKSMMNQTICNISVINKEMIRNLDSCVSIIEAGEYANEMDDEILRIREDINRFYLFYLEKDLWDTVRIEKINPRLHKDLKITRQTKYLFTQTGKDIYIYGINEIAKKYATILQLFDLSFAGFIDSDNEIEQILRKKDMKGYAFFILLLNYNVQTVEKLEQQGLVMNKDFGTLETDVYINPNYRCVLDAQLGHTSFDIQNRTMGFQILGKSTAQYKIVILGNSTTDGNEFRISSWPEFLYEKIGTNVQVYNGGTGSYKSTQELIKLIRDVITLKPNLVITFDGLNDTWSWSNQICGNIFNAPEQIQVYEQMKKRYSRYMYEEDMIYYGRDDDRTAFERWLSNIEIMKAICDCKQIDFVAFLQPMLASKARKSKEEKAWQLCQYSFWDGSDDTCAEFRYQFNQSKIHQTHSYIYDLEHLFDNEFNIYVDGIHVTEKGNEIIASNIYEVIQNRFRCK